MGFPATIRERALVASARHCCVCHRYKGINIEVHHIAPEASGGSNDFDNAVVLCFDCHADAGHYNAEHPRVCKNVMLTKGDTLRIEVEVRDRCIFVGYYQGATNRPTAPWRRNEVVDTFIRGAV